MVLDGILALNPRMRDGNGSLSGSSIARTCPGAKERVATGAPRRPLVDTTPWPKLARLGRSPLALALDLRPYARARWLENKSKKISREAKARKTTAAEVGGITDLRPRVGSPPPLETPEATAIVGALFGAALTHVLPVRWVRVAFIILMAWATAKMLNLA